MRIYKDSEGQEVDLDNPSTYSNLPNSTKELDTQLYKEIGYALIYMDHIYPDVFKEDDIQRLRIKRFIRDFVKERRDHINDVQWLQEKLYLFLDETENMC